MNIAFVEIKNFRKLKSCRIDLSPKSTIFVGANNSGKTSLLEAISILGNENSIKSILNNVSKIVDKKQIKYTCSLFAVHKKACFFFGNGKQLNKTHRNTQN